MMIAIGLCVQKDDLKSDKVLDLVLTRVRLKAIIKS